MSALSLSLSLPVVGADGAVSRGISPAVADRILSELAPVALFSDSVKTVKGEARGVKTFVQYLSPSTYLSRYTGLPFRDLCPYATDGCRDACLGEHSGRMAFDGPKTARVRRTILFHLAKERYFAQLCREIEKGIASAERAGMVPVFRLNGSSDILWEREFPEVFTRFPDVQFYDYTKVPLRYRRDLPSNYWLTFSRSGANDTACVEALDAGNNVAVVFHGTMPETFTFGDREYPVIDGDSHDIRLPAYDGVGVVVGLKAKGPARNDFHSGFVVHTA